MHETLLHALNHHVAKRGGKVFTRHLFGETVQELTFSSFQERAAQIARFLAGEGCGGGDLVLIFLPTSPEVLASLVGTMMLGGVPSLMPLPSAKQHPSIYWTSHRALLDRIKPRFLLTDSVHAEQMKEHKLNQEGCRIVVIEDVPDAPAEVPAIAATKDDVALLQHSSGTTALKKGVMLSHGAILRQVEAYASSLNATSEDQLASWLPVYHDMGLISCSVMPLVLGQTVTIVSPFQWTARPALLLDVIDRYGGDFVWMPNFAFEHLARVVPATWQGDLSGVRAFINCSEPCKPETFDRFRARFAERGLRREALQVCYAMAETVFAVSQTPLHEPARVIEVDREILRTNRRAEKPSTPERALRLLSNGIVIEGLTVMIRDPETRETLEADRVGEIAISGSFLFDGYYKALDITAERLDDGVYFTRDMGFVREGELYVLGRRDDLIIVNGRNLHAHEVEAIVATVPGLKPGRAVAFGLFNETIASEELVIVAERDSACMDEGDATRHVRECVFDQTSIDVKDVAIVDPDWLVKTTSGKISREKNRDKYIACRDRANVTYPQSPEMAQDTLTTILHIVSRLFRVPAKRLSRTTVAAEVPGWDSLAHATLVIEVEKALEVTFPDAEIFSFANIGALADRAAELRSSNAVSPARQLLETDDASIVRMGEAAGEADLVIFAGAAQSFGGLTMLDFASTLNGTRAQNYRKFFVTDKKNCWFTKVADTIAQSINTASERPKVLIGNSMGGYGALMLASRLTNVVGVLSFVPQPVPPPSVTEGDEITGESWFVQPTAGIPTCVIYGEIDDEDGKAQVTTTFTDPAWHRMLILPNCGHNVVRYLNRCQLLSEVLLASLTSATMISRIAEIIQTVEPSADELTTHLLKLGPRKMQRALAYVASRRSAEGLAPLGDEEIEAAIERRREKRERKKRKLANRLVALESDFLSVS